MDDIYNTTFPDLKGSASIDEEMLEDEEGIPPENVPGAAYVYQPIAEPTIEEPYYPNNGISSAYPYGYFVDDFYSPYYSPYYSDFGSPIGLNYSLGLSFSSFYPYYGGYFSLGFGSSFGSNYYYPGGGYSCPSSTSSGVSSTAFVAKRFSWNDNPEQSIEYINKAANSTKGIDNNVRSSKGRKSTYLNSNSTESTSSKSSNKWKNFFDTISNGVQEGGDSSNSTTRSRSTESGSSYGTRSSGSTRSSGTRSGSSGSSGSTRTGKRIR